jgi:hypothetical protein
MDATTELLPASAVREWANRISPQQAQEERFQKAFSAFDKALVATIEYLKKLREGGPENESEESELSSLRREASEKVRPLDADLANRCYVKGIGTPIQFSTGGGIAVFVVAFLMLLAAYH